MMMLANFSAKAAGTKKATSKNSITGRLYVSVSIQRRIYLSGSIQYRQAFQQEKRFVELIVFCGQ